MRPTFCYIFCVSGDIVYDFATSCNSLAYLALNLNKENPLQGGDYGQT